MSMQKRVLTAAAVCLIMLYGSCAQRITAPTHHQEQAKVVIKKIVTVVRDTLTKPVLMALVKPVVVREPSIQPPAREKPSGEMAALQLTLACETRRADSLQALLDCYKPATLKHTLDTTRKALVKANAIAKPIQKAIQEGAQVIISRPITWLDMLRQYGMVFIVAIGFGVLVSLFIKHWFLPTLIHRASDGISTRQ